jgi:hypothetical protein
MGSYQVEIVEAPRIPRVNIHRPAEATDPRLRTGTRWMRFSAERNGPSVRREAFNASTDCLGRLFRIPERVDSLVKRLMHEAQPPAAARAERFAAKNAPAGQRQIRTISGRSVRAGHWDDYVPAPASASGSGKRRLREVYCQRALLR